MPKYKKGQKRVLENIEETQKKLDDLKSSMFASSMKSLIIAIGCFVVSILFNGNIIPIETESGEFLDIVMIIIKSLSIVLFFAFCLIGLANSMELMGQAASIREVIIIAVLSLIQTVNSGWVFGISVAGILLIIGYLWVMQGKVETA